MMTIDRINQEELVRKMQKSLGFPLELINQIVSEFQASLIEALKDTGNVYLRHLGVFKVVKRRPTRKRLPNQEYIDLPERDHVIFTPGGALKNTVIKGEDLELREESSDLEGFREISGD